MIKVLALENFKCFAYKKQVKLAPITLLYGHNGRGKSSLSQALMLLGQSMSERNEILQLSIVGDLVQLDSFNDVKTFGTKSDEIKFWIHSDKDKLEVGFSPVDSKPQLGRLSSLTVNNENLFDNQSKSNPEKSDQGAKIATTSDIAIFQDLKNITYISAGRLGPVNDMLRNDSLPNDKIGTKGESLINALSHQTQDFIEFVGKKFSYILDGGSLSVPDPEAKRLELMINSHDSGSLFHPVNVGFGYSYILPVIVGTLLAQPNTILIIENPEAHLHPRAQSRIMEFLIEQALEKNLQLIVETHSDHVINGMRISMKKKQLNPNQGIILHFSSTSENPVPVITEIKSDKEGNLSEYPDDFMDELTAQLFQLL